MTNYYQDIDEQSALFQELIKEARTIPCQMCRIKTIEHKISGQDTSCKDFSHIESDGGCRHRNITNQEAADRLLYVVTFYHITPK